MPYHSIARHYLCKNKTLGLCSWDAAPQLSNIIWTALHGLPFSHITQQTVFNGNLHNSGLTFLWLLLLLCYCLLLVFTSRTYSLFHSYLLPLVFSISYWCNSLFQWISTLLFRAICYTLDLPVFPSPPRIFLSEISSFYSHLIYWSVTLSFSSKILFLHLNCNYSLALFYCDPTIWGT